MVYTTKSDFFISAKDFYFEHSFETLTSYVHTPVLLSGFGYQKVSLDEVIFSGSSIEKVSNYFGEDLPVVGSGLYTDKMDGKDNDPHFDSFDFCRTV